MFYISDITGAQAPYQSELFQLARQATQLPSQSDPDPTIVEESAPVPDTNEAVTTELPSVTPTTVAPASPTAVGVAAATTLYRDRVADPSNRSSGSTEQSRGARRPLPQQTPRIRPAERMRYDESATEGHVSGRAVSAYSEKQGPTTRTPAVTAAQIMSSPVITLEKDDDLARAGDLFRLHRFRHLPIVSKEGKLIGLLSDRDLLVASDKHSKIGDHMVTNVLTARPETEIRKIAQIMFSERIGSMPIVSSGGDLVGILTRSDILCTVVNRGPFDLWV